MSGQAGGVREPEDPLQILTSWLSAFERACSNVATDVDSVLCLFWPTGWWRDKLCLSWDFHTKEGTEQIKNFIGSGRLAKAGFHNCRLNDRSSLGRPNIKKVPGLSVGGSDGELTDSIEFDFLFDLKYPPGSGRALVRLSPFPLGIEGEARGTTWRAFVLFTSLESLAGHPDPSEDAITRPSGFYTSTPPSPSSTPLRSSWDAIHQQQLENTFQDPTVLVVGGGQTGLICAVRLWKLGIRVLVVERHARVGDTWRHRYDLLTLNTTVNHLRMPYQPYPPNMPTYMPKTKFADFMEYYAVFQEIPLWTSAEFLPGPEYDNSTGRWAVKIRRKGEVITVRPKHLVIATGVVSAPRIPNFSGVDVFRGQIIHSKDFRNASGWKGKKVVLVGAGVSGTEIALEAQMQGADVTIVQRSPICLLRLSTARQSMDAIWPPNRPIEDSDFLQQAIPLKLMMQLSVAIDTVRMKESEKELHEALMSKGFLVGWGEDVGRGPIGLFGLLYTKLGGFCLDIGCAQKIIDGAIKVKSKVEIERFDERGVIFSDGTRADVDIVVLATGFLSMGTLLTKLLGPKLLPTTPKIWDLDEEGELNGVFRPTSHRGLWYAAGGFNDCRALSKYLALHILALESGLIKDK